MIYVMKRVKKFRKHCTRLEVEGSFTLPFDNSELPLGLHLRLSLRTPHSCCLAPRSYLVFSSNYLPFVLYYSSCDFLASSQLRFSIDTWCICNSFDNFHRYRPEEKSNFNWQDDTPIFCLPQLLLLTLWRVDTFFPHHDCFVTGIHHSILFYS